jgi:hypothetical protein
MRTIGTKTHDYMHEAPGRLKTKQITPIEQCILRWRNSNGLDMQVSGYICNNKEIKTPGLDPAEGCSVSSESTQKSVQLIRGYIN